MSTPITHPSAAVLAIVLAALATPIGAQHGEHAGHSVRPVEPTNHAGHSDDRSAEHSAEHGVEHAPDAPAAQLPPITDADRAAAFPDLGDTTHEMMENPFTTFVLFDQLEAQDSADGDVLSWDLHAWFGRSLRRLWLRSEGERLSDETEHAELTLLYGRSFARWWDWVAGARQDIEPGPSRTWAAIGLQGFAPYRFELEATAFVGEGGRTAARLEAGYELLITNRLILQPLLELNWYGRDDPAHGVGSGLSSAEGGLRLRYEFRREIAPYVGLLRDRKFGTTADLARAAGHDADDSRLVIGVRLWF